MADHSHPGPGPGVVTQERESRSEDEVVGDDIDEESALKRAEELVTELYEFESSYIDTHGLSAAGKKKDDVWKQLEQVLKDLNKIQNEMSKSMAAYWRGKALNVLVDYCPEAEQLLSQAVKRHPSLVDAWNCLGECYWKSGKLDQAQHCFTGAVNRKPTKESLRNLSMILRQTGNDGFEMESNIKKSLEIAKQAVALDVTDGKSWVVLGNAHLTMYFSVDQDLKHLKQSTSSYQQAEKDRRMKYYSDYHFNRSTLLFFEEQYSDALESLEMSCKLDPSWEMGQNKLDGARKMLQNITRLVAGKGRLKGKRLSTLVQSLQRQEKWAGKYFSTHRIVGVKEVIEKKGAIGEEGGQEPLLLGVIVASVTPDEGVPLACIVVDGEGESICISLYNIAFKTRLNIGDVLGVPCPSAHRILLPDLGVDYWSVRVIEPDKVCFNGSLMPTRIFSPIVLRTNCSH